MQIRFDLKCKKFNLAHGRKELFYAADLVKMDEKETFKKNRKPEGGGGGWADKLL
jgi:hypothetical protein